MNPSELEANSSEWRQVRETSGTENITNQNQKKRELRSALRIKFRYALRCFSTILLFRQERDPVFIARDFVVRFLRDETPLDLPPNKTPNNSFHSEEEGGKRTQIKFTVGCGNTTQRVNLPFVRLTLQIVDLLELLSDLISKGDESERPLLSQDPSLTSPQDGVDGVQPLRAAEFPHGHVKCWRIMYQVVDLYSSLPREAKNKGFMRRSTIGRVLGGKLLKREILFTDLIVIIIVTRIWSYFSCYMARCK